MGKPFELERGLHEEQNRKAWLDKRLQGLRTANSKTRHSRLYGELADEIVKHNYPGSLTDAVTYLRTSGNPYSTDIIKYLNRGGRPEKIYNYLTGTEKVPDKDELRTILNSTSDDPNDIALTGTFLEGYLSAPSSRFEANRTKETLDASVEETARLTASFAEILLEGNEDQRRRAAGIWRQRILLKPSDHIRPFDFIQYAYLHGDREIADMAGGGLSVIGAIEDLYLEQNEEINFQYRLQELEQIGGKVNSEANIPVLRQKHHAVTQAVENFLNRHSEVTGSYLPAPERTRLGNASLNLRMEWLGRKLEYTNTSWEAHRLPGNSPLFVYWDEKATPGQRQAELRKRVREFLKSYSSTDTATEEMTAAEIDLLIANTVDIPDINKLNETTERLRMEAKGGDHALSSSGDLVVLKPALDKPFTDAGLRNIFFMPAEDGKTQVTLDWKGWKYNFTLDKDLKIEDGQELSEESQAWLTTFIYSYLGNVRNPEVGKINVLEKEEDAEDFSEVKDPEKAKAEIGRVAHLRTLHLGQQPQKILEPLSKQKALELFGVDIDDLNEHFLDVQADINYYQKLPPHEQAIILREMKKILKRPEKPRWTEKKSAHRSRGNSNFSCYGNKEPTR